MDYIIRYMVIPSRHIFNQVGPDNTLSIWSPRKVRIVPTIEKNPFYQKLESSILEEGFRNPILVVAGDYSIQKLQYLPIEWLKDRRKVLICDRNGGSRLWVAQKHNLDIPCIVNDYNNVFSDAITITNHDDLYNYYKDRPDNIKVTPYGIKVYNIPQIHLGGIEK